MTETTQTGGTTRTDFIITECADHGTKECGDYDSMRVYVQVARDDEYGNVWHADGTVVRAPYAAKWDAENGCEPWRCCSRMVIDPFGMFDH